MQQSSKTPHSSPVWLRFGTAVVLLLAICLLSITIVVYSYGPRLLAGLIPTILVTMTSALFLSVCSVWYFREEQRNSDQAFRNTDCEFSSIFENVLDGILILDKCGNCLDANPAAACILGTPRQELIGRNFRHFFADPEEFQNTWTSFLESKYKRGQAQLVVGDGALLVVDFTAAANYLPDRHVFILCDVTERTRVEMSLRKSEERFQHMANNIQEVFWMMDADTQEVTYVNPAYATITGHTLESLLQYPTSYRELIYPEDRIRFLSKLRDVATSGTLDEEFRFIRSDGEVRWVWAKGTPVPAPGEVRWLVGTAQDITSRKQAEMKIAEQLDAVEAARSEAEALRKSTLALSQNLAMDSVLDTLLQCISELIPFDKATVLFVEVGAELMVAREAPRIVPKRIGFTFSATENSFLQRILFEKRAILLQDVTRESEWRDVQPLDHLRSWLGIPLLAAGRVLGILSLGTNSPNALTAEHLRLAKSLAVPAAVAIQNARTHERAEIYAAELEVRLQELHETQKALEHLERESS